VIAAFEYLRIIRDQEVAIVMPTRKNPSFFLGDIIG
jgi:hypothetical protein